MHKGLSSNTLFHFTRDFATLLDILWTEFRPHYCLEDLSLLSGDGRDAAFQIAVPMVSFCDIPLSQTFAHMATYGRYALGLKKEWGIRNSISPVLYAYPDSAITRQLIEVRRHIWRGATPFAEDQSWALSRIMSFIKPYEESRTDGSDLLTRYYDEREWRYVPEPASNEFPALVSDSVYASQEIAGYNSAVAKHATLSFEPADIRYLVVATEGEILLLARAVEEIKAKYSDDDKLLLATRIVSAEQIEADF